MIDDLNALLAAGWHVKLMTDRESGPGVVWRCWLAWRQGKMPHQEQSSRQPTLEAAVSWLQATAAAWRFT